MRFSFFAALAVTFALVCGPVAALEEENPLDAAAERFVKLALAFRTFDPAYVDAYSGPEAWDRAAKASEVSLDDVIARARALMAALTALPEGEGLVAHRRHQLLRQVRALETRARMAKGETFSFNEEALRLFDVTVPAYDVAAFDAALAEMETLLPGDGPLWQRADAFRQRYIVPADKLAAVFDAALAECKRRTLARIDLPDTERFTVEFVTDKPWGGYNWYQGDYNSLIQVNTDLPSYVDRAVDLGCHEGYPGHHVHSILLERELRRGRDWIEFSVLPLYGPLSPIAEGGANYGIQVAFTDEEKLAFEREVLYPLAGLDPATADALDRYIELSRELRGARVHFGRLFVDGAIDEDAYIDATMTYGLVNRERAEKSLSFLKTYRSYIINYSLGLDIVKAYVEREAGEDRAKRWAVFTEMFSTPIGASDLK